MKNKVYTILIVILGAVLIIQTAYVISLERNRKMFIAKQRFLRRVSGFSTYFTMQEMPKEYLITMHLPGLNKEEINIELKDRYLTVSGKKKTEDERTGRNFEEQQVTSRSFLQVITLPEGVRKKDITSEYKEDNLTIHIPKKPKPRGKEDKSRIGSHEDHI